ncbi:hypothetical protein AB6A40_007876 [Gnathostoma spinigerum]|uniref:Uncharacterized protein n=1 Tax=Gnathostoma spinigerum TaxID=75299 RepID=A0ABD6EWW7_9BILA
MPGTFNDVKNMLLSVSSTIKNSDNNKARMKEKFSAYHSSIKVTSGNDQQFRSGKRNLTLQRDDEEKEDKNFVGHRPVHLVRTVILYDSFGLSQIRPMAPNKRIVSKLGPTKITAKE